MYVNKSNVSVNREEVLDVIRANGFALLVSNADGVPEASHLPLILSADGKKLTGHVAIANKQWRQFNSNPQVLAIFSGPHAYISSSWYDHENVPTWNYISVHVYGTVRIISESELRDSLSRLVNKYEEKSMQPISVEKMSPEFVKTEIKGIVGFEISVDRIESAFKLSQNRDDKNFKNVVCELEKRGELNSLEIANAMRKLRPLGPE